MCGWHLVYEDFLYGRAVCDNVAVKEDFGEGWGRGVVGGDGVSGGLEGRVEGLDEVCGGCFGGSDADKILCLVGNFRDVPSVEILVRVSSVACAMVEVGGNIWCRMKKAFVLWWERRR